VHVLRSEKLESAQNTQGGRLRDLLLTAHPS
jgi:hypothetical protein